MLIFKFCINEVKMMFGFNVIENIITVDIGFTENGIKPHFMMIKFASVNNKVLQDDGGRLEVDGESFRCEVG